MVLAFAGRDQAERRRPLTSVVPVPAEVLTDDLPNTSQKHHQLQRSQLTAHPAGGSITLLHRGFGPSWGHAFPSAGITRQHSFYEVWGIAQSVQLRAGRSGYRFPVGGTRYSRFSAHVQTGLGTHPASYTTGTGSFPGVKRAGRDADDPPPLASRLKKE